MADLITMLSAAAGAAKDYEIQRSLRFNSADSAYLSRTPASAGNRKTWTWSGWVKRTKQAEYNSLFYVYISATSVFLIRFQNDDKIFVYQESGGVDQGGFTSALFRDPSAWYHIVLAVDTTQATDTNRMKLYVNGSQVTLDGTYGYFAQNADTLVNSTNAHYIGQSGASGLYMNGYMTEINFIDGQALTPSSFGEDNPDTGVWQPKKFNGPWNVNTGVNGFYLNFSDNSNTTASTLGKDYSGNGNNWTPSGSPGFSVTAGAGNDSLVDVPTPFGTDTGAGGTVRGNYATLNPLDNNAITLANGNLNASSTSNSWKTVRGSIGMSSGKWYWEFTSTASDLSDNFWFAGIANAAAVLTTHIGANANGYGFYSLNGNKMYNNVSTSYGNSWQTNDVIGVAFDADAGKIWFAKNGTWQASGNPASGTNEAYSSIPAGTYFPAISPYSGDGSATSGVCNFGQRPFAYTAPSGFKALVTTNLPDPTIVQGDDYFNTVLYTGNGNASSHAITGVGFQPDFVWIKARSQAYEHNLLDAVRGPTKLLFSSLTNAEATTVNFNSFDSDGFNVDAEGGSSGFNQNGTTYVAWNWKANGAGSTNTAGSITSTVSVNQTSGFSIVTYTGTGSAATVGHGLGVAPRMILVKVRTGGTVGWVVYHASTGASQFLVLNNTDAASGSFQQWNSTAPTSTVFSLSGGGANSNASGLTYVAYCFAQIPGYSAFGSITGNGSADGPFAYLGFRPAFVMLKRTDSTGNWTILDLKREGYNVDNDPLFPNLSNAEGTTDLADLLSNGFKLRSTDASVNASGGTYVFAAFSSNPFKFALAR